ncbi:Uncharacterized protein M6B38_230820 [Iris pallida]|uniref:Uncharacterized protein n=1 Tax=Iris pallida TaxID=29817 RepID=A0AAX6DS18_IRIPA|nr:Uncharacterized protein M6B38_230820 [Iris pallida]
MTKTHPQATGSSSLPERSDQAEEEVHETAPSDSTILETQAVAQGGLPPPPQRVTAVLPEIQPPPPPIPTGYTSHIPSPSADDGDAAGPGRGIAAPVGGVTPTDRDAEAEYGELASACPSSSGESGTGYGAGPYMASSRTSSSPGRRQYWTSGR